MPYIPNPDDATNPTDAIFAETAQAEFRALKGKVNNIATSGGTKSTFRQGILACAMTGDISSFLTAGAGLAVTLLASASALILTMAAGFNNAGAVDINSVIGADQASYWTGLPANNLSYLSIDNANNTIVTSGTFVLGSAIITAIPSTAGMTVGMNLSAAGFIQNNTVIKSVDTATQITMTNNALAAAVGSAFTAVGTLAPTNKLAPPQYNRIYDTTKQTLLQFGGAAGSTVFLDDFGTGWAASGGAKIQTNSFKFGTGGLGGTGAANSLNGTTDFVATGNISNFGQDSWSIRCWVNPVTLPGAGSGAVFLQLGTVGAQLQINNVAGVIKFTYFLSSNGSSFDIANGVAGTTTPVIGTWYFVELTWDKISNTYRLYINGIQEASTSSGARLANFVQTVIGSTISGATGFNGYMDKVEFLPYCQHPAGTAYAVPVAAPSIIAAGYAGDWFDLNNYIMWQLSAPSTASGSPPIFTEVNRVYVGEVTTNGAGIASTIAYSPKGEYISSWIAPLPAATTVIAKADNLGVLQKTIVLEIQNLLAENGFLPNDIVVPVANNSGAAISFTPIGRRNTSVVTTGTSSFGGISATSPGTFVALQFANWSYRFRVKRNF